MYNNVYCNIMCKWVYEKDYCTMFEPGHTMEEFEKEVGDKDGNGFCSDAERKNNV